MPFIENGGLADWYRENVQRNLPSWGLIAIFVGLRIGMLVIHGKRCWIRMEEEEERKNRKRSQLGFKVDEPINSLSFTQRSKKLGSFFIRDLLPPYDENVER